ncbi:MAG: hypothetical protein HYS75_07335 [Nitrosopumilales archaeon]|nr:hypothetical protein [Nitrosopumilales archaeon]
MHDSSVVYIGIAVFAGLMTVTVILMLKLNWEKILGHVAPWTLKDDEKS